MSSPYKKEQNSIQCENCKNWDAQLKFCNFHKVQTSYNNSCADIDYINKKDFEDGLQNNNKRTFNS